MDFTEKQEVASNPYRIYEQTVINIRTVFMNEAQVRIIINMRKQ